MSNTPAFELDDVSKRYGPRWALARLSFSLPRGASLLLTGHNGSGKSTLLRMLATASFPSVGKLTILGQDCRAGREALRHQVGLLSHASFHYEDLSAEQNLTLVAQLLGKPLSAVPLLLEKVGLKARSDSPVRQFSAGMRKRLAIARILLKAPALALFDEPFGELDPVGITQMEGLIRELKQTGSTVVLATHLIEQGIGLTDRRLHLAEGRAIEATP
ncbi:MAG: ABC transporter ATP-binding protein [Myxococcaceae bacterium]|nr:ABC transporter ATP-binding protein [Myxococcaceae bacterium]